MTDILSPDSPLRGLTPRQARLYWADELESGKWKQGKKKLKHAGRHCCLGVLGELVGDVDAARDGASDDGASETLRPDVLALVGLDQHDEFRLTNNNDNGKTFAEIAAALRKKPSQIEKALK